MSRWLRDVRLLPIVLIAVGGLFALKAAGLMLEGSFSLGERLNRADTIVVTRVPASPATQLRPASAPLNMASPNPSGQRSWAQEMFNYPDVTGSVPASKEPAKEPAKDAAAKPAAKDAPKDGKPKDASEPQTKPAAGTARPADVARPPEPARPTSAAERAILERLVERRQALDARARELELRENLLKASEQALEAKLAAIKEQESHNSSERKNPVEAARFKGLITMYETMKPKDAAKIFDRLDMKVLLEVASQINPRRMSEIMALMSPESAEKLTIEFASRSSDPGAPKTPDLPKIDGKPTGG